MQPFPLHCVFGERSCQRVDIDMKTIRHKTPFLKRAMLLFVTVAALAVAPSRAAAGDENSYLLTTHWYQDGPFARLTPNHERVGCWSTAYAQILYYHRLRPAGQVRYQCSPGQQIDVDLDAFRFDWSRFADEIGPGTSPATVEELARYSFATAVTVRKDFGTGGYKRLLNSVDDLEAHFPVEAEIYVHLGDKLPLNPTELAAKLRSERVTNLVDRAQIVSLLEREIGARRPVYFHFGNIKDFGHSTVIDGFRKEGADYLVHINYGAREAEQNKWFALFAPIAQPDDETLRAFVTIKPRPMKEDGAGNSRDMSPDVEMAQMLRGKLRPLLAEHHVPAAAVAVIRDGQLMAAVVEGERELGKPATDDTLFNVASLTKPLFAHAVLALVDKGQFNLDDSLAPHWVDPDLRDDPRQRNLTARIILSHETGFPNWRDGRKLRFTFNPGEGVSYSGEGFEYLRRALEAKEKRSMVEIVSKTVLQPCHMTDTHFTWDDAFLERFALEHDKSGRRIDVPPKRVACAADDLLTTIGDYGRFAAAVAKGANLSSALFQQICTPQIQPQFAGNSNGPADYGLCWRVVQTDQGLALGHGGSDQGVRAAVMIVPKAKDGVVVLTNGDNGGRIIEAVIPLVLRNGEKYLAGYIGRASK